jgi:thioesterase domain-containing protein
LFSLIRCELGFHAPLSILYSNSTPRRLASVLKSGSRDEDWRALVAINPNGNRTPLFLVHAAEGNVLLYRSLAAHLGADQPVFGLQSMGLDGSPIDARFEEVARHYVREIRQMQPHGPYLLGGYCLGGTLAFEMAQQLIQSGESVGLVALIETYNIRSIAWPLPLHQRFVNHFFLNPYFHLQNLLSAEGVGKLDFFIEKLRVQTSRAKVSARLAWAQLRHRLTGGAAATAPRRKISDIYEEALGKYEVRTYPGELTLILAEKNMAGFRVPLGGWGKIAEGGVQSVCLSISPRGSMVEPHVAKLASVLRSCLDRATSAAPACTSELVSKSD